MTAQNTVKAEGIVAHLEGKAWVRHPDGSLTTIHVGDRIAEGGVIVTADNSVVELRASNGEPVTIGGGREVLADSTLLTQETPTHHEGALVRPGDDMDRVVQALQSGTDPFDVLDPAAAGLNGGGANESHSFVRLLRIVEGVDPLHLPGLASPGAEAVFAPDATAAALLALAPTINADKATTSQDSSTSAPISGGVLNNDIEPNSTEHLAVTAIQAANGAAQTVTTSGTTVVGHYGTLTIHADGSYTYTPNAGAKALGVGETGVDTFTYTAANSLGNGGSATLSVSVTGTNDAPSAHADTAALNQGTTLAADAAHGVLANDTDPDTHDVLHVVGVATQGTAPEGNVGTSLAGSYGHLTLNADGSYSYVADKAQGLGAGVTAQDAFTYQVSDGHGGTSTATLSITVTGLHAAPTLSADSAETDQNTTIATSTVTGVLGNDVEPNLGDHLTVTQIQSNNGSPISVAGATSIAGAYGTLTIQADGAYTFVPNAAAKALGAGESALDTFTYAATDAHGYTSTSTLTIKVDGLNDTPIARADSNTLNQGATQTQNVLSNDSDPDAHDTLHVVGVTAGSADPSGNVGSTIAGAYGHLTLGADGAYTYVADKAQGLGAGATAQDTFTYQIADNHGATSTATLTLTVNGLLAQPGLSPDAGSTDQNTAVTVPVTGGVLSNDTDPNLGDHLAVTAIQAGSGSAVAVSGATTITGAYGDLTINADGSYTYTPGAAAIALGQNAQAVDSFTYTATDAHGGTGTATLSITVNGLNDAPTASNDFSSVNQNATLTTSAAQGVLLNDHDPDAHDTLSVVGVVAGNGTPLGGVGTVIDGAYGHLTLGADGAYTYVADKAQSLGTNVTAQDSFTYQVSDGHGATSTATLTFTINGLQAQPSLAPDANTTDQNTAVTVPVAGGVLNNDTDPNLGDHLAVTAIQAGSGSSVAVSGATTVTGAYGDLTINADGSYTYTPGAAAVALGQNAQAIDSFTYTATDAHGGTGTATLSITVNGLNDAPTASNDFSPVNQNATLTTGAAQGVLINDHDPDAHDTLSVVGVVAGSGTPLGGVGTVIDGAYGHLTLGADGAYTYVADKAQGLGAGATAQDTFTYQIADSHGVTSTATLTLTVNGLLAQPTLQIDTNSTDQNTPLNVPLSGGVLNNDTDPNLGDHLAVTAIQAGSGGPVAVSGATTVTGAYGDLTINADGSYTYTPGAAAVALGQNAQAIDSFTYTATDAHGGTGTATLSITVNGLNDAPTASNDFSPVNQNATLTTSAAQGVLINDHDPDTHDTLSVVGVVAGNGTPTGGVGAVIDGAYGHLTLGADGAYTYVADKAQSLGANTTAQDTFTYQIADSHGVTSTATLTLTVNGLLAQPTLQIDTNSTDQNTPLSVPLSGGVLNNDTDPNLGDHLAVTAIQAGAAPQVAVSGATTVAGTYGYLTINADGSYTYTPGAAAVALGQNAQAVDSFTYTATDAHGGTGTATLSITVNGLNDAPAALNDTAFIYQNAFITQNIAYGVLANDRDPDSLDTISVTGVVAGAGVPLAANIDTAIAGNYGHLTLHADGSYTYNADNANRLAIGVSDQDRFTYQVSDGHGGTSTATLAVTVMGLNDAPTASPDTNGVTQDALVSADAAHGVLQNDADPDIGDTLHVTGVVAGATTPVAANLGTAIAGSYGHLTLNSDGSYAYIADKAKALPAGTSATDTFTYQMSDGHGGFSTSTLKIDVSGTNDAPLAQNTSASGYEHPATPIALTLSGTDVDGSVTGFKVTSLPANGTLYLDAAHTTAVTAGSVIPASAGSAQVYFVPSGNWSGTTSFDYVAHDNNGADSSSPAAATISVTALNDAPTPTMSIAAVDRWAFNESSGTSTVNAYSSQTGSLADANPSAGGTTPTWTSGHNALAGTALSFDGKGGYVALASSATQALNATATLSMWINTTQSGSSATNAGWANPSIIGTEQVGSGQDIQWGAISNTGKIGLGYGNVNGVYSAATINDGNWHQVVITRTLDTTSGKAAVTIYVDGTLSASGTIAQEGTMATGVVPNHFAGFGLTNGWQNTTDTTQGDVYYKGQLDSARIYDHALTANQAHAVYLVENGYSNLAVANDGDAVKLSLAQTNTTSLSVTGLEAGMVISDGSHTATASGNATAIDLTGWNTSTLQVSGLGAGASATLAFDAVNTTLAGQTHDATSYINIVSGTSLLAAGNGNVTVSAPNQASLVVGGTGNQTLNGGDGNDRIIAGTGTDTLNAGAGNDVLIAGHGNASMTGGLGNDVFRFELGAHGNAGSPNVTTVTDFSSSAGNSDVLDMRDLLQGESHLGTTAGNLSSYLHITHNGSDTIIEVSSSGGFSGGYAASAVDQKIVLQNVDLTNGGTLTTDNQIINDLLSKGKLHSD